MKSLKDNFTSLLFPLLLNPKRLNTFKVITIFFSKKGTCYSVYVIKAHRLQFYYDYPKCAKVAVQDTYLFWKLVCTEH